MNIIRPQRKPDLVLPEVLRNGQKGNYSCCIEMWLAEELFSIHDNQVRKYVSTDNICEPEDKFTPLMYIYAAAEKSDIPIHKKLCQEFIFDRLIEEELTKEDI